MALLAPITGTPLQQIHLKQGPTVAVLDQGPKQSEPVLFIHGIGGTLSHWELNVPDLSKYCRCIAWDMPNYGASAHGDWPASMAWFADVTAQLLDALSIPSAHICGHSMGGQIALHFARRHPERLRKLILVAPAGFEAYAPEESLMIQQMMNAQAIASVPDQQIRANVALNFHKMPPEAEILIRERVHARSQPGFAWYCKTVERAFKGMLEEPVNGFFRNLHLPALIIFGENDRLIPNRYLHPGLTTQLVAERAAQALPDSRLVMLPECGHIPQMEYPEQVNYEIYNFLQTA